MVQVLVTGAAGLVGGHVCHALRNMTVIRTYHRAPAPGGTGLDITDEVAVRRLVREIRPGVIVLGAADPYVERCEREPEATRRVNVDAVRTVAECAADVGAALVVFSSEYVFNGTKGRYVEQDPVAPLNEYGRQKVAVEEIARSLPRHLVCRTSGVFGQEPAGKNFVCQLERTLRAGKPFIVPSDQLITPTYAPALAKAVAELIQSRTNGIVHVVGPRVLSRTEFALLVCDAFGLDRALVQPRPTDELGLLAPRPRRAGLADDLLRTLLGSPLLDPAAALAEMRNIRA